MIQLNYITGWVLRKPFKLFFFLTLCHSEVLYFSHDIHIFFIRQIPVHPDLAPPTKQRRQSFLVGQLAQPLCPHHTEPDWKLPFNCKRSVTFLFRLRASLTSFLHLGGGRVVHWEAQKWDELDGGIQVKNPGDERVVGSIPGLERIPWSKQWQTIPVFLPGKFHRQRSLARYSPWVTESQTQLNMNTHVGRSHFINYEDSVFAHIHYTLSYKLDYSVRFNIIS